MATSRARRAHTYLVYPRDHRGWQPRDPRGRHETAAMSADQVRAEGRMRGDPEPELIDHNPHWCGACREQAWQKEHGA